MARSMRQFAAALIWAGLFSTIATSPCAAQGNPSVPTYDLVVYGGTSGGVIAAVQAKRMGHSAVIVCPDVHLGGLSSGGLGWTDSGNKAVIGGLARDFYHRVYQHYQQDQARKWQKRTEYGNQGQGTPAIDGDLRTMWIFEPHVAEKVFDDLVQEFGIPVYRDEWLDRESGVTKRQGRIVSIRMLSGRTLPGRMFIDATYEGDLMAAAGVAYHVGRESREQYGEQWAGVQTGVLHHRHHFGAVDQPISPYVVPGDPASGLLPRISPDPPGEYGAADKRVQAYCFRMCLTDDPRNRIPFPKPVGYDPGQYELLLRIFQAGWRETFQKFDPIPNHKTDTNNHGPFSTDNIGFSYDYPEASYARRREIIAEHELYQKGLMYFIANDPRVPDDVRTKFAQWGLAADEFTDNGNWPHQIYVREARRMIGEFVMTENELLKRRPTPQSIGMGSYAMDSHNVQRYVTPEGYVQNEGDIGVSTRGPYEIAFRSILPKKDQCQNLIVPVCLSSSHIAFGSIRMEPVFMILGQSAATAASLALKQNIAVQDVRYDQLREQLLKDGQVLGYADTNLGKGGVDPKLLKGVVVDDSAATLSGNWSSSATAGAYVGRQYLHDGNASDGRSQANFQARLEDGSYEVRVAYSQHANRATNVPITVQHAEGSTRILVNQQKRPSYDELFESLGTFTFNSDHPAIVTITNQATDGHVIVDALQFLRSEYDAEIRISNDASPLSPEPDVPGLPRVLLIGDSISIGYTLPVRKLLAGKANVHRPPTNCSSTGYGLSQLDAWLGEEKWDVIHFNFGLHDAKLPPEGVRHAPLDVYEKNLRALVTRLKASGAQLIWATTTPVPLGGNLAPNRRFGSIDQYNTVAHGVMQEFEVAIDDLHAAIAPDVEKFQKPNDVHFTEEGSQRLAEEVAAAIEKALSASHATSVQKGTLLYAENFSKTLYGRTPNGWRDLFNIRPSRNWAVDGNGFLRPMLKKSTGLLIYDGYTSDAKSARELADGRIVAEFRKTEDATVAFGVAGRVIDQDNYYLARFSGMDRLELLKVTKGIEHAFDFAPPVIDVPSRPSGLITLRKYREGDCWTLSLTMNGSHLAAAVLDAQGQEQARLEAVDGEFQRGAAGLCCTTFASTPKFRIEALQPFEPRAQAANNSNRKSTIAAEQPDYPVVRPYGPIEKLSTPREEIASEYDTVVAGAGTGGWAAAIQAARMGARVLLVEETDWIGGQMSCAGVTTMDEDSGWMKFPVRERGIYREFHESMVTYYQTLDKDPFVAYFGYPEQKEGGYEPRVARAVLYGFIDAARQQGAVLDLTLQTRVTAVRESNHTVTGVTVEFTNTQGNQHRDIACQVLIDATEYGDVIPLTTARYRVGNCTSDHLDPAALVQDHTWTAIVREYPQGVPEHLQIKSPPPGYETGSGERYRNYANDGFMLWGSAGKGVKGHRSWRVYFTWRGMADSDSPLTGERSRQRHTQCGFNGGNDYPVTVQTIEDPAQRRRDEREGIYKTLGALYYFQQELGVNWSLAEDEGYNTAYNQAKMRSLKLRADLESLAVQLPQQPYVRECRRVIGVRTLVADDLTRYSEAKHFSTSVAMGDYFMDLDHGKTAHAIEPDLDAGELPRGGGPFQVPYEVFIPEKLDGFLPAEKNISQSRLANGATRLQPVTMLTGQAAGAIAALAAQRGVQPRALDVLPVQRALLDSGCTLIQRWYADVPWGTPLWRATQLLSLHQVMDRPGAIEFDSSLPLGSQALWGANKPLQLEELLAAVNVLAKHAGRKWAADDRPAGPHISASELKALLTSIDTSWAEAIHGEPSPASSEVTAGQFAMIASRILLLKS